MPSFDDKVKACRTADEKVAMIRKHLGVPERMAPLDAESFLSIAREQLGVPFSHQGRNPAVGLDCFGLVVWAGLQTVWVPRNPDNTLRVNYPKMPRASDLIEAMNDECDIVEYYDLQPGDLMTFRWGNNLIPRHIAIVDDKLGAGEYDMLHTHWKLGRVTRHGMTQEWKHFFLSGYRLKGMSR